MTIKWTAEHENRLAELAEDDEILPGDAALVKYALAEIRRQRERIFELESEVANDGNV